MFPIGKRLVILGRSKNYSDKVLVTQRASLIAFWPLWEMSGATAYDVSGNARNGSSVGVTVGQAGIGDGKTSYLFDGLSDYVNIYSASLAGAFSGDTGTAMAWANCSNWTDGLEKYILQFQADANNFYTFGKNTVNNQVRVRVRCNGTFNSGAYAKGSGTWMHVAITWAWGGVNTVVTPYIDGAAQATVSVANRFTGAIAANQCFIGAASLVPTIVWNGYIAYVPVWSTVLTPAEILELASVT